MNPQAMEPFGQALLAHFQGDAAAEFIIHRDDGQETALPASIFFRDASEFTPIDRAAMDRCAGHVLDVGAGSGLHSLFLQQKGLSVTAIDISPQAVNVMKQRGLADVYRADIIDFQGGPFDTLLMLGHGIGMVETLAGLDRFLTHAHVLLTDNGQVLLDSLDVRLTDDPSNLAYQLANRRAGRYFGEIRMKVEFQDRHSPQYGWLHVDTRTLEHHARTAGWQCETIRQETTGDHLTRLTRS
ncbi:MAG: class I SAM-dependent methyltransferase [Phycisphaerae bacterium]